MSQFSTVKWRRALETTGLSSLTPVPGQIMEEMPLGSTEKHLEDSAGISHSQHSFMKESAAC